jgi:hypothetical protein
MPRRIWRISACLALLALTLSAGCVEVRVPDLNNLAGDPLNPETHRAAIVAVDAVLFEDGPLGQAGRDQVEKTLLALSEVAAADPANTIAAELGKDLKRFSAMTSRARVGTPLLNSQLRHQWLRIRSSLFDDAWWFRRSSADPIMR